MAHFVMLTRVAPEILKEVGDYQTLSRRVDEEIRRRCPGVKWLLNLAVLGPYDYLDVFEAASDEEAARVSMIVRALGHATTETWSAVPWERFKELTSELTRQQLLHR
ncbi:MAG TPA: GYD domain-containing protein [Candidatus Nitrosotenuis sp.]|jgi:uncharacterized protein with GYD domain|nr:GYD domain-containing protein [Candidatus Nitrosotenuis sp.]